MLCWNVFVSDFNTREIKHHNVLQHYSVRRDLAKAARKYKDDKEAFAEEARRTMMYHYWCKCEWEIVISHWPPREGEEGRKVDVYEQVRQNWEIFIDWLWEHRKELIAEVRDEDRKRQDNRC